jgi:hypothetical protein
MNGHVGFRSSRIGESAPICDEPIYSLRKSVERACYQMSNQQMGACVIVQAGRRVDAADSEIVRFPSANVDLVRQRIKASFLSARPLALVTAAACGTDLLALEVAGELHMERFVLVPSAPEIFRTSSVTDRPGDWGSLFDDVIKQVHVEVLALADGQEGYLEANLRLLDRGQAIAEEHRVQAEAMVVWDQKSRGPDDVTEHFIVQARLRKLPVMEIPTL